MYLFVPLSVIYIFVNLCTHSFVCLVGYFIYLFIAQHFKKAIGNKKKVNIDVRPHKRIPANICNELLLSINLSITDLYLMDCGNFSGKLTSKNRFLY